MTVLAVPTFDPFIVLEHLEHCSGTVHSNKNFLVIPYFYRLYIPLHEQNYLISCASSFFTYRDTFVCILTLNLQTIPCNWHIDEPWQHLPPY